MDNISEQWFKDYDYLYHCDFTDDLEISDLMYLAEDFQDESMEFSY